MAAAASTSALAQNDCYVGEIRQFGGNFAPRGTAFANGQLLAINEHDALFSLLGTTYGGDGRKTFALPDLRGRVPIGQGQGPGLVNVLIGERSGTETTTYVASSMASHTHDATTTTAINGSPSDGNTTAPAGHSLAANDGTKHYKITVPAAPDTVMAANAVTSTTTLSLAGNSTPVTNIQPSLATNYIVCLVGIYPSRN